MTPAVYSCREVIINVMEVGTACDEDTTRVQSQAVTNLVSAGVSKSTDLNEAPDWGLIIGQYTINHHGYIRKERISV